MRAEQKRASVIRRRNATGDVLAAVHEAKTRFRREVCLPSRGRRLVLARRASEVMNRACRELSALLDLDGKGGVF